MKKRENQGEKGGCGRWERGVRKIGKAGRESKDAGSESQERWGAKDAKGGTCGGQVGEMGTVRARISGKARRESKVDVAFSGKGSARGWNKDRVAPFFKIPALPFLAFALAPAKRYEHLAGFVQRLTCGANYNGQ